MDAVGVLDDGFDLAGFDALTVDLDHPVLAVEEEDVAVVEPLDDVTGLEQLVKAVALLEEIVDKGLGGLLLEVQIAVGEDPRKAQLAFVGFGAAFVENVGAHIAERLADGGVVEGLLDLVGEYRAGGLGLSVHDVDLVLVAVDVRDALAAGKDIFQRIALLLEDAEHLRADEGAVDLIVIDVVREQHRIAHRLKRHEVRRDA